MVWISRKNFFLSVKLVPGGIKYPTPMRFSQLKYNVIPFQISIEAFSIGSSFIKYMRYLNLTNLFIRMIAFLLIEQLFCDSVVSPDGTFFPIRMGIDSITHVKSYAISIFPKYRKNFQTSIIKHRLICIPLIIQGIHSIFYYL